MVCSSTEEEGWCSGFKGQCQEAGKVAKPSVYQCSWNLDLCVSISNATTVKLSGVKKNLCKSIISLSNTVCSGSFLSQWYQNIRWACRTCSPQSKLSCSARWWRNSQQCIRSRQQCSSAARAAWKAAGHKYPILKLQKQCKGKTRLWWAPTWRIP